MINNSMPRKPKGRLSKKDESDVDKILNNLPPALREKTKTPLTEKQRLKLAVHIKNILEEYLDCFFLVGYTPEGLRTFIVEVDSPMQQDALNGLIEDTTDSYFAQQDFLKHGFPLQGEDDDEIEY